MIVVFEISQFAEELEQASYLFVREEVMAKCSYLTFETLVSRYAYSCSCSKYAVSETLHRETSIDANS